MDCNTSGLPVHHQLSQFTQWTQWLNGHESVMPSNHLILCHPLFLQPSIFPSIRVLSSELAFSIRCQSIGASASVQMKKWLLLSAFKPHFMCWPKFQKIFCFSVSNYVNDDFSSVQFSCLVVSDSLRPHELQHARAPCQRLWHSQ